MNKNDYLKFAIVPYENMEHLLEKVENICQAVLSRKQEKNGIGDYISEQEAKDLLGKGTTWFWNKRKSGELVGRKAGNKWYYKQSEIFNFIDGGEVNL